MPLNVEKNDQLTKDNATVKKLGDAGQPMLSKNYKKVQNPHCLHVFILCLLLKPSIVLINSFPRAQHCWRVPFETIFVAFYYNYFV